MKRVLKINRLARREEKNSIKRIFLLSAVSLILAILVFTVGIGALGKFADLLSTIFKGKDAATSTEKITLRAPQLDPLPQATNSAKLAISGFADDGTIVVLYEDNQKKGEAKVANQQFLFQDFILQDGENKITAKTTVNGQESEPSQTQTVILNTKEPKLEIETPYDGQSFSGNNRIRVTGKTDSDAQVYANGFLASVNLEGAFEVLVPVAEGETKIEIKAVNEAGNTKTETRKVNFKK